MSGLTVNQILSIKRFGNWCSFGERISPFRRTVLANIERGIEEKHPSSSDHRAHPCVLGKSSCQSLLLAQARSIRQHFSGPPVDVELHQERPHRPHAIPLIFQRHCQRRSRALLLPSRPGLIFTSAFMTKPAAGLCASSLSIVCLKHFAPGGRHQNRARTSIRK